MVKKENDSTKYIESLENEISTLRKREKYSKEEKELDVLLKKQEEFLTLMYKEKDNMMLENQRLTQEIATLNRTISLNHSYIDFLMHSFWWKFTFPLRFIYRSIRNKKVDYQFLKSDISDSDVIDTTVSVIIYTYNPGEEFKMQLKNLKRQKNIKNLEIIIIDKGSVDSTKKYSKEYGANFIDMRDTNLSDSEIYEKIMPSINGEYIVLVDQNKIVDSDYWVYQSIIPIMDNMAVSTVFFKEDVSGIRDTSCYRELKSRMVKIANEQVLFFPSNRDTIQFISPIILDKSSILVKKKVANIFLV